MVSEQMNAVFTFAADPDFLENDIRVKPDLDALGALGDAGWAQWYLLQQFEGTNSILTTSVQSSCGINHSDIALISYLIQDNLNYIKKEYPTYATPTSSQAKDYVNKNPSRFT
ncbi:hypothetical protein Tco_0848674 [Tanacetum coccineum]